MSQVLSPYVKLTTEDCIHNGYKYEEGLNVLNGPFDNQKVCNKGGLYFCRKEYAGKWVDYNDKIMHWIWDVVVPDEAKIVDMNDKLKTDKFILSNKRSIWLDQEICKLAVKQDGYALRYVEYQTEEICKLAVQEIGCALYHVKESN